MFDRAMPRAERPALVHKNPLAFLVDAQAKYGDIVLLTEGAPIFSRASDCAGCVAVFGPDNIRQVLTEIDDFGMPVSVGTRFALPETLGNLKSGLFSLSGEVHRERQRI